MSIAASAAFCWSSWAAFSCELRQRPLGVVVGLFDQLLRAGDPSLEQVALALVLELVAQHVGLRGVDRRLGLLDERLLDVALVGEVGERRLGGGEIGLQPDRAGPDSRKGR